MIDCYTKDCQYWNGKECNNVCVRELENQLQKLKQYAQHKPDCLLLNWEADNELPCDDCNNIDINCEEKCEAIEYYTKCKNEGMVCTCGLDDLLKELK